MRGSETLAQRTLDGAAILCGAKSPMRNERVFTNISYREGSQPCRI